MYGLQEEGTHWHNLRLSPVSKYQTPLAERHSLTYTHWALGRTCSVNGGILGIWYWLGENSSPCNIHRLISTAHWARLLKKGIFTFQRTNCFYKQPPLQIFPFFHITHIISIAHSFSLKNSYSLWISCMVFKTWDNYVCELQSALIKLAI